MTPRSGAPTIRSKGGIQPTDISMIIRSLHLFKLSQMDIILKMNKFVYYVRIFSVHFCVFTGRDYKIVHC